jgi:tetratricopeptide (TPR) repeat protein
MKDIEYFSEARLNESSSNFFFITLPTHLQKLLRAIYKKTNSNLRQFLDTLQGYRGPTYLCNDSIGDSRAIAAESGVQEIKFWFGMSKHWLWHPFYTFVIPFERLSKDCIWISVFFDELSGEMLSEIELSRKRNNCDHVTRCDELIVNSTAEELFSKGLGLLIEKKYTCAVFSFKIAHGKCSILERKQQFERKIFEAATSLWNEAWELEVNKYNKAAFFFKEALDSFTEVSRLDPENREYSKWMEICKLKIDGNELVEQGNNLINQGRTDNQIAALSKFRAALQKFSRGLNDDSKFEPSIRVAESLLNEIDDTTERLIPESSMPEETRDRSDCNDDNASVEELYTKGLEFLIEKKFKDAVFSFKTAHRKCSDSQRKQQFECKIVKIAKTLWNKAWKLEVEDYETAAITFKEAFDSYTDVSKLDPNNVEYSKWMRIYKLKIDGNELVKQGNNLIKQEIIDKKFKALGKFEKAKEKFSEGLNDDSRFEQSIRLAESYVTSAYEIIKKLFRDDSVNTAKQNSMNNASTSGTTLNSNHPHNRDSDDSSDDISNVTIIEKSSYY